MTPEDGTVDFGPGLNFKSDKARRITRRALMFSLTLLCASEHRTNNRAIARARFFGGFELARFDGEKVVHEAAD